MIKKAPIPVPALEQADAYALQAIWDGRATPDQQKRGMKWILESACQTYDFCTTPENERLSAIFDGRRYVGLQIVRAVKINATLLKKPKEED